MGDGVLFVVFGHGEKEELLGVQKEAPGDVVYYLLLCIFWEDGQLQLFDRFLTIFLEGLVPHFVVEYQVVFIKDGVIVFGVEVGVFPNDLTEIQKLLLGFLSDLFVGGLYRETVFFGFSLCLSWFVVWKYIDGLVSFPFGPDEVAAIDLVHVFEGPPRSTLDDALNQQSIVSLADASLVQGFILGRNDDLVGEIDAE